MGNFGLWLISLTGVYAASLASRARSSNEIPNSFIVESTEAAPHDARSLLSHIEEQLAERGVACRATLGHTFNPDILKGASFQLACDNGQLVSRTTIQGLPFVHMAWPNAVVKRDPEHDESRGRTRTDTISRRALHQDSERSPSQGISAVYPAVARELATASNTSSDDVRNLLHTDAGVARLHAEGVTGAGIRVALIDEAFDLTPPALSQTKVVYAQDLTTGTEGVEAISRQPGCESDMHGAHTLGLVAGKGDTRFNYVGVAPDADIEALAYGPGCVELRVDSNVKYYTDLYGKGLDVITQPNSANAGFPEFLWTTIVNRLLENGTLCATTTGNKGPGVFTAGAPTEESGLEVGGYDPSIIARYGWLGNWTAGSESGSFRYHLEGTPNIPAGANLTLWWPWPLDQSDPLPGPDNYAPRGASSPNTVVPANGILTPPDDPSNTVLLYNRFSDLADPSDGQELGAKYNISYALKYTEPTSVDAFNGPRANTPSGWTAAALGSMSIGTADAATLVAKLKAHGSVHISVTSDPALSNDALELIPNPATPLSPTPWTGWGPTLISRMGPTVLGPANFHFHPLPTRLGGFGVWRGTSFSAPYVGAVAALIKSARPEWSMKDVRNMIVAAAIPVPRNSGWPDYQNADYLAPLVQQGGGRVQAWAAARSRALVNTRSLDFNDTANRAPSLSFTLTNIGEETASYALGHRPAASTYLLNATTLTSWVLMEEEPNAVFPAYAEIDISPATVTLEPGASADITVRISAEPPVADAATRLVHFGGYVSIDETTTTGEPIPLTVPYTGVSGRYRDIPVLLSEGTFATMVSSEDLSEQPMPEGFVFTGVYNASADAPVTYLDGNLPGVHLNWFMATRKVLVSMVNTETGEVPVRNQTLEFQESAGTALGTDKLFAWEGVEFDRAFVPAGRYRWEIRGLRNFGDFENPADYDAWTSPEWVLQYTGNSTDANATASR